MRLALIGLALVLLLAGALWWARSPAPGDASLPAPAAPAARAVEDVDLSAASEAEPRVARDAVAASSSSPAPVEGPATGVLPEGRRVEGRLFDSASGLALTDYLLVFTHWTERTPQPVDSLRTDASGGFRTAPLPFGRITVAHQADLDHDDRSIERLLEPFLFELPEGDGPLRIDLEAQTPGRVLVVDVERASGEPAVGVVVDAGYIHTRGGNRTFVEARARTGTQGRARLGIPGDEWLERIAFFAEQEDGAISPVTGFEGPPTPGVQRLRLVAAAGIELSVAWPDGSPAAGQRIQVRVPYQMIFGNLRPRVVELATNAEGLCLIQQLPPGAYGLFVSNPRAGRQDSHEVELQPGQVAAVNLTLSEGELELIVAGSVLDEEGAPIEGVELVLQVDDRYPETLRTDVLGRFESWGRPCELANVRIGLAPESDSYQPGEANVPGGTEGLVFRRVARAPERAFRLEAVDRVSGEVLEAYITFDMGEGTEEWNNTFAPRSLYRIKVHPAMRASVGVAGYVVQVVSLQSALERAERDDEGVPQVRVQMSRGLSHSFHVIDADTLAPIAGVELSSDTAPTVYSDENGVVRVEAADWSLYRVRKDGYADQEWDPADYVLHAWGALHLYREQ